ncbi:VWA domain-containing protein [Frankia tisae]|uniref:VWA domain-containing protein n=1 Tax=Frankia tisae TaxID=2950104 RepID=UPI0021BE33E0|nr:VWA domain-containing protein [Frankia tisae]
MIDFTFDLYQDPYLPLDATDVDALVTITGTGNDLGTSGSEHALVIIVDASGSMGYPSKKLVEAKRAAVKVIAALREGTSFALIAGTAAARQIYPESGLAVASPPTVQAATAAICKLAADGGTAIGRWLTLTNTLLSRSPATIRQAILLTDGKNESEPAEAFRQALHDCEGNFRCDCRGIGEGWVADELTAIASTLLGTALDIPRLEQLEEDFLAITREAASRQVAETSLRVWLPYRARLRQLRQVHPTIDDLTDRGKPVDGSTTAFPAGSWGQEVREYQIGIGGLDPVAEDKPSRAGRVDLVRGDVVLASKHILAHWTDDYSLYTQTSRTLAKSKGQTELGEAINAGVRALRSGDLSAALDHLERAVRLAHAAGDERKLDLLRTLVIFEDAARGAVVLRSDLHDYEAQVALLRSAWTRGVERDE